MFFENGPPIEFLVAGETAKEQKANLKAVKSSPGYDSAADLCAEAIFKDADMTVLDFSTQQVSLRFQIDGLWHSGAPMEREEGDYMLATLKELAGVDYRERRASGNFGTMFHKKKQKFKLVSQGIKTGERVALYLDYKRPPLDKCEELGMRASMISQIHEIVNDTSMGIFVTSAVPGEGFTKVWRGALDTCDRLTRDYYTLEHVGKNEPEVINVYPIEYDSAKGEDAMSPLAQLMLKEPDVLAFPDLESGDLLNRIVDHSVAHDLPMFTRIPGKNSIDALRRILALKPNAKNFAKRLSAVLSMRLIRLLCDECKIGFKPTPQMLQQLGLPQGRIAQLFRPMVYKNGMVDEKNKEIVPCSNCCGIGYRGRTGLFELLVLNDELRSAMVSDPKANNLAAIAKRHRHVSMQMEGIVMIASGKTSIDELQRVLKS